MIDEYYRMQAEETLNTLYAIANGFSGGEGCQQFEQALRQRLTTGLEDTDSEDYSDISEDSSFADIWGFDVPGLR